MGKKITAEENVEGKYKIITFEDGTQTREYWPGAKVIQQIEDDFTYHAPRLDQIPRYKDLRDKAKELAELIVKYCPDNRNRATALTNLQLATMLANASIASGEK